MSLTDSPNSPADKLQHEKFDVLIYLERNPDNRMEFPFYGSYNSLQEYKRRKDLGQHVGHTIRDYDVLASIACETYCPSTIEEFIDEYGYEIKRGGDLARVQRIFDGCRKMHDDLHRVFPKHILEKLYEIQ